MKLKVVGGKKLKGTVKISICKNAILPLCASCLVLNGGSISFKISTIEDIKSIITVMKSFGVDVLVDDNGFATVSVNHSSIKNKESIILDMVEMKKLRVGIYFLGPLLAMNGNVSMLMPGGDNFGERPVNFHVDILKAMGADIILQDDFIIGQATGLNSIEYTFSKVSTGATYHALITSVFAKGTSVFHNCAIEPEVIFIYETLKKFGVNITKRGTTFTIHGVGSGIINSQNYTISVIPDRIEAFTYLCLGLITDGDITIECENIGYLCGKGLSLLSNIGGIITINGSLINIKRGRSLTSISFLESEEYPGFPTDCAPLLIALLGLSNGISSFKENIFHRFQYIKELRKIGINIVENSPHEIIIHGISNYIATHEVMMATDLRGGMSMLLSALSINSTTIIDHIHQIDRGYDNYINKLTKIGADVSLID